MSSDIVQRLILSILQITSFFSGSWMIFNLKTTNTKMIRMSIILIFISIRITKRIFYINFIPQKINMIISLNNLIKDIIIDSILILFGFNNVSNITILDIIKIIIFILTLSLETIYEIKKLLNNNFEYDKNIHIVSRLSFLFFGL